MWICNIILECKYIIMGSKPSIPGNKKLDADNSGSKKNELKPGTKSPRPNTPEPLGKKDLMISYSHQDKEMMARLRDNLEANGITVWVDVIGLQAGVDFLSKIGQAIIDAKLFITLLSFSSIKSKYCKDEVALAYISQKAIFPVVITPQAELLSEMDTGMKLQLATTPWNMFLDSDEFDKDFEKLLSKLKQELDSQSEEKEDPRKKRLKRKKSSFFRSMSEDGFKEKMEMPEDYWTRLYKESDMVSTESETEWLTENLKHELDIDEELEGMVLKENFMNFCLVDGDLQPVWPRIQDYTSEMFAIQEVFSMDSSVRIDAIENLGRFQSNQVIENLRDLSRDKDSNIRSVAAISLAKTGNMDQKTIKVLMNCLNDKDRLVREAGCLALGHLGAKKAVPRLLHLWRNDFISHVREAAQAALEQIGGEEVDQAMHITKVLAEEIRMLTEET
ncbi:hypothetical protein KUTeg_009788 [Tegillarca granosa]|uniref:TIR domain-containing protein n=2 Tax=Tegillarca granosa TaxID=220873 RepID=A0ABQ9F808_TEGGR|nr:hypothetical protein KUTeg_009788 [Tegillarca granosa]